MFWMIHKDMGVPTWALQSSLNSKGNQAMFKDLKLQMLTLPNQTIIATS
jgi:hypothetical protein